MLRVQFAAGLALPLSERPVAAEVSKQDLFVWHAKAEVQAKAVGTAFEEADGGPSAEDLLVLCSFSCGLWFQHDSTSCNVTLLTAINTDMCTCC